MMYRRRRSEPDELLEHAAAGGARPTWVEVDLGALGRNTHLLRDLAGVPLLAVVKANAYGHGAVPAARVLLANGAAALAVATLEEAAALRRAGIAAPCLLLGPTHPAHAALAAQLGVTCTVFELSTARALSDAAGSLGRTAAVHVKVDTGMGRLGLAPEEVGPLLRALSELPHLRVEGLYTHFASADEDEAFTLAQLRRFERLLGELAAAGLRPSVVHAANSAALLRHPAARFDMVRPGIACYGLSPFADTPLPQSFLPALSFHSEIVYLKKVPPGSPLSYGGTFTTARPSLIATVPVGYADGLRRAPPWREVLVRGRRAPVVGRITMDYTLVDVTKVPGAHLGDRVTLIGAQGAARIAAEEVADWFGTIVYEVVTSVAARVPRRYRA